MLRSGISPAAAIRDIFLNGPNYGFECATAVIILMYKGVLDTLGESEFNRLFPDLLLYSWHSDSDLGMTQDDIESYHSRPGDVLYFKNPEVNPEKREWQGENVIKLDVDLYYGHGIGIKPAREIIAALNRQRRQGATESAYLMDMVIYPDYQYLSQFAPGDIRPNGSAHTSYGMSLSDAIPARIGSQRYIKRNRIRA